MQCLVKKTNQKDVLKIPNATKGINFNKLLDLPKDKLIEWV